MRDIVEKIGKGTIIQHGKLNDRIYLMKLDPVDSSTIVSLLNHLAIANKYSKIFCKIPKNLSPLFISDGFHTEAHIPNFFDGNEDVFFMSKFIDPDRCKNIESDKLTTLSDLLSTNMEMNSSKRNESKSKYSLRSLDATDVDQITAIYREVFESYPFPIHNPGYILKTMNEDVQYFGAEKAGKLVALASSEIDFKGSYAEMTDFATHPDHHGNNLSKLLLDKMEESMQSQGIKTVFTIARLNSIAMNKTFIRNTYNYSGTLVKNTNISGKIESMNVYYKKI